MNPSSLEALIIDRHFGELTPEVAELLELHLAQNPAARTEADRIELALGATRDAMLHHPELARVAPSPKVAVASSAPARSRAWMARAAAALLLSSLAAGGGYMAGSSNSDRVAPASVVASVTDSRPAPRKASPWAQYRVAFNSTASGMQVVRVDTASDKNSIQ